MKIKINTTVILAVIITLTAVCTWFIPAGSYEKQLVDGKDVLVEGSFHYIENSPQSGFEVLKAPMQSFARSTTAEIMAFLLIIGGAFMIIEKTGAITAAITRASAIFMKHPGLRSPSQAGFFIVYSCRRRKGLLPFRTAW